MIREDPDVLGEQRARHRADAVEVEAAAGNDLGGIAATAPACEDARDSCLIQLSCCRAITGYATDIDWMDSMVTDLLFLKRFFGNEDPWANIERIHASVLDDFAPARRLGFQLYVREPAAVQPAAPAPAAATTITASRTAIVREGRQPMNARFFIAWAVTFVAWMAGSFVVLAQWGGEPKNSTYVPAHMENGKLVPGTMK